MTELRKHPLAATATSLALVFGIPGGMAHAQAEPSETDATRKLTTVTVTAQKREESLQDVPVSVAAVDGERLVDTSVPRLENLTELIPNFSIAQDPIGDKINIRGIQSGNNAGLEQSVSTFVDGVYRGRGVQSRFAFLDPERVEILRGPQGTLFGKNTIGGAVSITTARPTDALEYSLGAEYTFEGVDQYDLTATLSGPLSDKVRGRIAGLYRNTDEGYIDNTFYDSTAPELEEYALRGTLEVDLSPNTLLTTRIDYGDFDLGQQPFSIIQPGPLAGFGVSSSFSETSIGSINPVLDIGSSGSMAGDTLELAARLEHEFERGTLTAIAAYSEYDFLRLLDADFSPLDLVRFDDSEDFTQTSFELRWTSTGDGPFQYLAGLYYQTGELLARGTTDFNVRGSGSEVAIDTLLAAGCQGAIAAGLDPTGVRACLLDGLITGFDGTPLAYADFTRVATLDQSDDLWAVFAQGTYDFSDQWALTVGLRYSEQEKEASQSVFAADFGTTNRNDAFGDDAAYGAFGAPSPFLAVAEAQIYEFTPDDLNRSEGSFTWSANLQYTPNADSLLYASAATGFKAGGFNSFAFSLDPDEAEYEEEQATGFELGGKFTLLNGAAELNTALFYTEFDDIQTALFTGSTSFIVQNAAKATTQGIEIDGRWAATDSLTVNGSLAYVDFEFDEFPNAGCTVAQLLQFRIDTSNPLATNQECSAAEINDLSGETSEHTPEVSASIGLQHQWEPMSGYELVSYLDIIYQDEQFRQADLDPVSLQEAFTKVNYTAVFGPAGGNWDVALIAKNIFDEDTFSYVNDTPLVDGALQFIPDRPRTVALRVRLRN